MVTEKNVVLRKSEVRSRRSGEENDEKVRPEKSLLECGGTVGKLKPKTTRRLQSSVGTVWSGEVWRGLGKRLWRTGPAVATCEISAAMKESIASERRTVEEWLDLEGVGTKLER